MNEINTGGPAFPVPGMSGLPNSECIWPEHGMTLRDYFAAKAMQAAVHVLMDKNVATKQEHANAVAKVAYRVADAMLAAREKGGAA